MCLIAVKKRGVYPSPEFYKGLVKSFNLRNKDGCGFAIKKKNRIYISKGYFSINELIDSIKSHNLKKEDELMVHLRKVSAGGKDIDNCHPFVCSDKTDEILKEEGYVDKPVVAHNGTIAKYIRHGSPFSDTFWYVKEKLSKVGYPRVLAYLSRHEPTVVSNMVSGSRLAIMFPGNEVISLIGDWKKDESTGIYYSNTSYRGNRCEIHGDLKYSRSYGYHGYCH